MLILVEGVDGVGKSTFVDRLASSLQESDPTCTVRTLKAGPPPPGCEILAEYELPLQEYTPGTNQHWICDRWHMGEWIYGPLLRGQSLLDVPRDRHLRMFLRSKGAYLCLLVAPVSRIVENRRKRGGLDLLEDEQVEFVQHRYIDLLYGGDTVGGIHTWGTEGWDDATTMGTAIDAAMDAEKEAESLAEFNTYIGPSDPHYLLLGDVRNQKHDQRWDSAFVPSPTGNSGYFLLDNLPVEGRYVGIANAHEVDVADLYKTLDFPPVVALGVEAHKVCEELSLPHGRIKHPQWMNRFAHNLGFEYGHQLRKAALFEEDFSRWPS